MYNIHTHTSKKVNVCAVTVTQSPPLPECKVTSELMFNGAMHTGVAQSASKLFIY